MCKLSINTSLTSDPDHVEIFTIDGNASRGFKTTAYRRIDEWPVPAAIANLSPTEANGTICYGGDLSCAGVSALKPSLASDLKFFLDPRADETTKSLDWYAARKPFSYSTLSFAESQQ